MKRLVRTFLSVCLFISLATLLTGCYGRNEMEETAFVTAFGIDKGSDKEFKLTILVPAPGKIAGSGSAGGGGGEGGSENPPYWLASAEGRTLWECFQELSKRSSRRIQFAHAAAAIIHENVARQGLEPLIDTFHRNAQMRPDTNVLVTTEPIEDILQVAFPLESLPSAYLARLQLFAHKHSQTTEYEVGDFYASSQAGQEAVIPRVSICKESTPPARSEHDEEKEKPPPKALLIEGAAVFRQDRQVGWLDGQEIFALESIRGRQVRNPLSVEVDGIAYTIVIRENYRKIKVIPNLSNLGNSEIQIKVRYETDLGEVQRGGLTITNEVLNKVAVKAEEQVSTLMRNLIQKAKYELASDIFGFGELIRRKVPERVWRQVKGHWNKEFPNLIVSVDTEVIIRRLGMTVRSPYIE